MKKSYNYYISPQNTPNIKLRRLLYIISNSCLVINLIVFAILLPDIRLLTFGYAFVFIAYIFLQLFDKKRDAWAWWNIILGVFVSIAIPVFYIILFELYLYFVVIAAQIIISSVIVCVFRKK